MRIAVVNRSNRLAGGIEVYLQAVIAALRGAGHDVGLFHESESPVDRAAMALPDGAPRWCLGQSGLDRAIADLAAWRPDLLYVHTIDDPEIEARLLDLAPALFFAHQYHGTCISGGKSYKQIVQRPCHRVFGWGCFLHYYPHRCGGLNPAVMVREYERQNTRLRLLRRYRGIVTHSEHMCQEYRRHGFDPAHVSKVPFPAAPATPSPPPAALPGPGDPWRIVFAGRMEVWKGGHLLLAASSIARERLNHPLHVTFAGDGRERPDWEREARRLCADTPGLTIEFKGWLEHNAVTTLLGQSHLLVVPSFWPEPFGMVGPEAGAAGVPAAAFAVGGIPEWLSDGVNGCLADGAPPTAKGLAGAILRCLTDRDTFTRLREGARRQAERFTMARHVPALLDVFRTTLQP